jgi:hypothetical protein
MLDKGEVGVMEKSCRGEEKQACTGPKQLTVAERKLLSEKCRNAALALAEYWNALAKVESRVGPLNVMETDLRVSGRDAVLLDLAYGCDSPSEITLKRAEMALSDANSIKLWGLRKGTSWRDVIRTA